MAKQHLRQYLLSVIGGYQLQAASSAQEFGAFLKTLREAGCGTKTFWAHLIHTMYDKLVIAKNMSSLGVISYIIGQLWYNGTEIVQSLKLRDFHPNLTAILRAFCCRVATFVVSPKYAQVIRQQKDLEEGLLGPIGADEDSGSMPVMTRYAKGPEDRKLAEGYR